MAEVNKSKNQSDNKKGIDWKKIATLRKEFKENRENFKEVEVDVLSIKNSYIPYGNISVPIRIYTPFGKGPFPIMVYFHGGGFVLGDIDTVDNLCSYIAKKSERIVISVGYRLAPEHPFPAAINDAWAALQWVHYNAHTFNGTNIDIAVAGDSAGGNLAALTAIKARDSNLQIGSQWLFYPWLDFSHQSTSHDLYGESYNLTTKELEWFLSAYLPNTLNRDLPSVSPLKQSNLSHLPDAIILTAQFDPLHDDGKRYAKALKKAGNHVDYSICIGMEHSFLNKTGEMKQAKEALDQIARKLKARDKDI